MMPGDLIPTLNLRFTKSDTKLILKQIRQLERERAHEREFLLRYESMKKYLETDIYDGMIRHIKEEIDHIDERIRAYEGILGKPRMPHNGE